MTFTLTLDRAILHTVMHHSSTSTYIQNFIEIEETVCGRTYRRTFETHFIRSTLRSRPYDNNNNNNNNKFTNSQPHILLYSDLSSIRLIYSSKTRFTNERYKYSLTVHQATSSKLARHLRTRSICTSTSRIVYAAGYRTLRYIHI